MKKSKLRRIIREELLREDIEVPLEYTQAEKDLPFDTGERAETVSFSRNQSDDPIGLVPMQASAPRNMLSVRASCKEFLDMATEGGSPNDWMAEQVRKGRPLAPPWLEMVYVQSVNAWYVRNHEGRSRCKTLEELADRYKVEVPLDLFLYRKPDADSRPGKVPVSDVSAEAKSALRDRVVPQWNSPIRNDDQDHVDIIVNPFRFETA